MNDATIWNRTGDAAKESVRTALKSALLGPKNKISLYGLKSLHPNDKIFQHFACSLTAMAAAQMFCRIDMDPKAVLWKEVFVVTKLDDALPKKKQPVVPICYEDVRNELSKTLVRRDVLFTGDDARTWGLRVEMWADSKYVVRKIVSVRVRRSKDWTVIVFSVAVGETVRYDFPLAPKGGC